MRFGVICLAAILLAAAPSPSPAASGPAAAAGGSAVLDRLQRADGVQVVPERFLRRWDPVTVFLDKDTGPAAGGPEDQPEKYVTLAPAPAGAWQWLGPRVLQFRPAEPWQPLRRIVVTALGHATTLVPLLPAPVETSPADEPDGIVDLDAVRLTFTDPVDEAALARLLTIELRPQPGFAVGDAQQLTAQDFTIKALERAAPTDRQTYAVTLHRPMPDGYVAILRLRLSDEPGLDDPSFELRLRSATPFTVTDISCGGRFTHDTQDGVLRCAPPDAEDGKPRSAGQRELRLRFSAKPEELDIVHARNALRITPPVDDLAVARDKHNAYRITGRFLPDTVYDLQVIDGVGQKAPGDAIGVMLVPGDRQIIDRRRDAQRIAGVDDIEFLGLRRESQPQFALPGRARLAVFGVRWGAAQHPVLGVVGKAPAARDVGDGKRRRAAQAQFEARIVEPRLVRQPQSKDRDIAVRHRAVEGHGIGLAIGRRGAFQRLDREVLRRQLLRIADGEARLRPQFDRQKPRQGRFVDRVGKGKAHGVEIDDAVGLVGGRGFDRSRQQRHQGRGVAERGHHYSAQRLPRLGRAELQDARPEPLPGPRRSRREGHVFLGLILGTAGGGAGILVEEYGHRVPAAQKPLRHHLHAVGTLQTIEHRRPSRCRRRAGCRGRRGRGRRQQDGREADHSKSHRPALPATPRTSRHSTRRRRHHADQLEVLSRHFGRRAARARRDADHRRLHQSRHCVRRQPGLDQVMAGVQPPQHRDPRTDLGPVVLEQANRHAIRIGADADPDSAVPGDVEGEQRRPAGGHRDRVAEAFAGRGHRGRAEFEGAGERPVMRRDQPQFRGAGRQIAMKFRARGKEDRGLLFGAAAQHRDHRRRGARVQQRRGSGRKRQGHRIAGERQFRRQR